MKKIICIISVCIVALVGGITLFGGNSNNQTEYLRIHIRANSNMQVDQEVKYAVKAAVVEQLTPLVSGASDFKQAYQCVGKNLDIIVDAANKTLKSKGFDYTAKARLCQEEFPTRSYQNLTLEGGVYDALIVELGSGKGDNWWCVVFPPLCFVSNDGGASKTDNIKYKSLIAEWIAKAKEN